MGETTDELKRFVRGSVDALAEDMRDVKSRVVKLEISKAREEERHNQLVSRLDKIDGHMTRVIWIILTGVGGAFVAFVLRGGLLGP